MKTCRTCRYWDTKNEAMWGARPPSGCGICTQVDVITEDEYDSLESWAISTQDPHGANHLITRADFGCILYVYRKLKVYG